MRVGLYQRLVVPYLVHLSMGQERLVAHRRHVVPRAIGRVLEIGVGSGLNFRFYVEEAGQIVGIDPSPKLLAMARAAVHTTISRVGLIEGSAEALPLEDRSVDTVVSTWTLCSIPEVELALREMRRVLRPSGTFLFVEHGEAPESNVARWQHRLDPVWTRLAGGCHLDRPIDRLITDAGFAIDRLDAGYMEGPKVLTFLYEGVARPR